MEYVPVKSEPKDGLNQRHQPTPPVEICTSYSTALPYYTALSTQDMVFRSRRAMMTTISILKADMLEKMGVMNGREIKGLSLAWMMYKFRHNKYIEERKKCFFNNPNTEAGSLKIVL